MKPVLILQHEAAQGPGYLLDCLHEEGVPVRLLRPDLGDSVPRSTADVAGLVVLGSDHSVHDAAPWIHDEQVLIRDALARRRAVLGHCFGAQQLARATGAQVSRNPCPDIGWRELWITPTSRRWFGGQERLLTFNWHYEGFQMPAGATRMLFGPHHLNKGFALGPHIGLQSHLEVTEQSLRDWCAHGRHELAGACASVQSETEILSLLPERLQRMRLAAGRVYRHWMAQLDRPRMIRAAAAG